METPIAAKRTVNERAARVFAAGVVSLAAIVMLLSPPEVPAPRLGFWIAACVLGEMLWVRLPVGRATLTMAITANFAAVLLLPRGDAMLVVAASTLVAEALVLRKPRIRCLFNAAQSSLAAGAAALALGALGGGPRDLPFTAAELGACLAAAIAYTAANTLSVSIVVGLQEGLPPLRVWRANFGTGYEMLSNGALFSLGIAMALLYARAGLAGAALVALPLVVLHRSYRVALSAGLSPGASEESERRAA